ncbi:MAG: polysaccharide deacetylase-like protein [Ignavibacteriae bacterium]|nr:polysaccharide deacetylase-like protein [Ignavibacteriota bacterium]
MNRFLPIAILFITSHLFVSAQDKFMSVTIDDMPFQHQSMFESEEQVELVKKIIDHFQKYDVPAVGFVYEGKLYNDKLIDSTKLSILKMWLSSGLELGNHTFSHLDINQVSFEEYKNDLLKGAIISSRLSKEHGIKYEYFRHPYLRSGETKARMLELREFLKDNNYKVAPVTIDNSEWIFAFAYNKAYEQNDSTTMKKLGTDYISYMIAKVKYYEEQSNKLFRKNIKQVLLIHANLLNADYLGYLLKAINEYDYKFITLDETISDKAYETENNYVGRYGPSWIHRWALTKGADESFFAGNPKIPNYIKDYTNIRYE